MATNDFIIWTCFVYNKLVTQEREIYSSVVMRITNLKTKKFYSLIKLLSWKFVKYSRCQLSIPWLKFTPYSVSSFFFFFNFQVNLTLIVICSIIHYYFVIWNTISTYICEEKILKTFEEITVLMIYVLPSRYCKLGKTVRCFL